MKKTKKGKNQKKTNKESVIPAEETDKTGAGSESKDLSYDDLLAKLTDRAARFVQEYLIDLNREKAAVRAGYSAKSARTQAYTLMQNPDVIKAMDAGKKLIAERAMINQDEVIKELALIGFADMQDFIKVDESGCVTVLPLESLPKGKSRIIKRVKERRIIKACQGTKDKPSEDTVLEATLEFELHDKVKSLLGILDRVRPGADDPQKVEHTHKMADMPPAFKDMAEWAAAYQSTQKKPEGKP